MKRLDFLQRLSAVGLASLLPLDRTQAAGRAFALAAAEGNAGPASICTLIPSETAGPYPLNLSGNAAMFRQDIRELQSGVQLDVTLKVFGTHNCGVIQNARVDLWHCNLQGYYSGYTTSGQQGQQNHAGETWCRGIQMTDSNGEVRFTTIFPGWYSGRVTHIHFQVYLNTVLQVTSQFTFPVNTKNQIYTTHPLYAAYGADPAALTTDNVFSDGYSLQMATLTPNATTGGYDAYFEFAINASGVLGMLEMEPETGGQFRLQQNYPNPGGAEGTTIPFTLLRAAHVLLEVFDMNGRKVCTLLNEDRAAGDHEIRLDRGKEKRLTAGNYVYQITTQNSAGTYHQCKVLTLES